MSIAIRKDLHYNWQNKTLFSNEKKTSTLSIMANSWQRNIA